MFVLCYSKYYIQNQKVHETGLSSRLQRLFDGGIISVHEKALISKKSFCHAGLRDFMYHNMKCFGTYHIDTRTIFRLPPRKISVIVVETGESIFLIAYPP